MGSVDFGLFEIIKNIISELKELETRDDEEVVFKDWISDIATNTEAFDMVHHVIKSQAKGIRKAIQEERPISVYGIGQFQIKAHDRLIFNLMKEVAKEKGYDNLKDVKCHAIMRGIKNEVNKRRKPILQEYYRKRREVRPNDNPAVISFDFRDQLE
jgi:nucleoid DNA-binding protein